MPIDPITNFGRCTLTTGYNFTATSIVLTAGEGLLLPDPDVDGEYNLEWWNSADYGDPSLDPNKEIVRVTGPSGTGDTKTIVRAQEGTSATDKNISEKTYSVVLGFTKLNYDILRAAVAKLDAIEALADVTSSNETSHADVLVDGDIDVTVAAALGLDDNYVTDAEKTVVGNTSGLNSGDDPADNTAYNATSWDANTDAATKNVLRDQFEVMLTAIGLNTAKETNIVTNLSEGTATETTVDVNSSDGTNATIVSASTLRAGLLTKAKFDEIVGNTAHKTSDGSDHTFIDQDVGIASSPVFVGTNVTAIPAANMNFNVLGAPTYKTAQDWFNIIQTAGVISGFELSNSRNSAELDIATGTGIIKTTDSALGPSISFDFAGVNNVTLTNHYVNYIYLDYNAGTPQILATTDRSTVELNRQFTLGRVYKKDTVLHVLSAPISLPNLARNEHERLIERDGFTHASGAVTSKVGTLDLNITAGVWYLGQNRITTDVKNSDTGGDTWYYTHYGAASWIDDNLTASLVDTDHYNAGTDVLGELTPSAYGVQWVYLCSESCVLIIYGTSNGQLSAAEAESPPTSVPNSIEGMGELIAKMIVRETGVITDIQPVHDISFSSSGVINHNETGGLNLDDYKHLTAAQEIIATQAATASLNGYATAAQITKLEGIETAANNYTHPNHSGDVTSVADGATTIGAGKVTEAMQILADNATNNVSTTKHGYVPKLTNDVTKFLNDQGAFTVPAGNKQLILYAGAADIPATAPAEPKYAAASTVHPERSMLGYDDSQVEYAYWDVVVPNIAATATISVHYLGNSDAGNLMWAFGGIGIADNENSITPTEPTMVDFSAEDTVGADTNHYIASTTHTFAASVAETKLVRFGLARNYANETSPMIGDANLMFVVIDWNEA